MTVQQAFDLALEHHRAGRLHDAERIYRQILAAHPDHSEAIHHLGVLADQAGKHALAIDLIGRSLALNPDSAGAYSNLSSALRGSGQFDEAIVASRHAVALRPDFPEGHNNLGTALRDAGQLDASAAAYQRAISLRPDYAKAHFNLGHVLLAQANFAAGWEEYEWRWKYQEFLRSPRNFSQPRWDGGPLNGRTILIHAEQGFGDAIQFFRYLPLVAQRCTDRGGRIVFECPVELERLFQRTCQTLGCECQIIIRGHPLPHFDLHCPLLSLPRAFATTLESIPAVVPYLAAEPAEVEFWRGKVAASGPGIKVGLAWTGRPTHISNRVRSLSLDCLAPLATVDGVRFFSLQKGASATGAKSLPPGLHLIDWMNELSNFNDAALIANLDLIITIDTVVAHLAGALGKPAWVLLSFSPDWRWMREREDSPWYPTMRLFRQMALGDWATVVERVADALSKWRTDRD